ncbi:MAG: DUF2141 domain-containing protein [Lentimicrobium sp.]|nr:DUF2141 domain-containing protein [Lentimicrobium sp.]
MRIKVLISILFFFSIKLAAAQLTLTIIIYDLQNNNGKIHLELSNENQEQLAAISKEISKNMSIIVIENLKPGNYAFKFFHDENGNNKLDTNRMGIPIEGFGFSNNPKMTFGPPPFRKTVFEFNESKVMKCKPKYF